MSYDRRSNIVCCENCGTINKVMQLVPHDVMPERRMAPLIRPADTDSTIAACAAVSAAAPADEYRQDDRLKILKTELDQLGLKVVPKLKNSPASQIRLKSAAACGFLGLVTLLLMARGRQRR